MCYQRDTVSIQPSCYFSGGRRYSGGGSDQHTGSRESRGRGNRRGNNRKDWSDRGKKMRVKFWDRKMQS